MRRATTVDNAEEALHAGEVLEVLRSRSRSSDVIESSDGRLSHIDCTRPRMLTAEERALLFVYCYGHAVGY
jgi:hypothetical protein